MKVLANDGISQAGIDALESAGYTVLTENVAQEDLIETINRDNIEVLLVRSATTARKDLIDACPKLQLIGRGGVGMDNIDVEYARGIGRTVINTPAASSQSVAELVLGHFCAISRSLHDSYKNMETGEFSKLKKQYAKGVELRGKTLAIIGFGRIGQSLASYAIGCGMNVVAVDHLASPRTISLELGNDISISVEITPTINLIEGITDADFISVHVPKQDDGSAVFGSKEFESMKDGVRIVNAARGGVIDEDALLVALDSGKVAAVALDVFENEPNPRKDLLNHPKIACTPHIGAATVEAQDRIGTELASSIVAKFGVFAL
ncbi:MAG: D-2-hydroxyacid dehydrogenase [Crocinitomicaceae bacterium]|nr:D-2-hydroxyacid dehydrogenase [Flavobacteriales bacterium]NQZ35204.1 D-2-hydroxyacid dehydrogenase [Crocinitomicaceae bacterium]